MPTYKEWDTLYPASVDSATEFPELTRGVDPTDCVPINKLGAAVIELETEVGTTTPASGSLRYRVDELETAVDAAADSITELESHAYVYKTAVADSHIYVDGSAGNDSNDGLTALTPLLTLTAAFAKVPFLVDLYNVVIHLTGTFNNAGTNVTLACSGTSNKVVLIDGGSDVTVLSGPHTADISSTSTIGLTSLTLTPDQYRGHWVQILDGALAGQTVQIHSHDATTVTFMGNLSSAPTGASFQIVRPATTISGTSILRTQISGGVVFQMQRVFMSGSGTRLILQGPNTTQALVGVLYSGGAFSATGLVSLALGATIIRNPASPEAVDSTQKLGFSHLPGAGAITVTGCVGVSSQMGVISAINLIGCVNCNFLSVRLGSASSGAFTVTASTITLRSLSAAYRDSSIENVTAMLSSSTCSVTGALSLSGMASHGIDLQRSTLSATSVISGSGLGGAGVYAHDFSLVSYTAAPTVTGTVGDCSTDGTTQASTWAAITAGTPVNNTVSFTNIRKV